MGNLAVNKKVLVVDDEQGIAELLSLLLRNRGFEVVVALSGSSALEELEAPFDIILLDLVLPDYHGFTLCEQIKSNPKTQGIPIIIVSGNYQENTRSPIEMRADDYLAKPFEPDELFSRMDFLLRRRETFVANGRGHRQLDVITELKRIIDHQLVEPHFQPIFRLDNHKIIGYEVLSRPMTSSSLVNPQVLFAEALKYGLYFDVEMIAWRKAIKAFKSQLHLNGEALFLNCSPQLIESDKFASVEGVFNSCGMDPQRTFLEITERTGINEEELFYGRLRQYRDFGFKIAVDDVGGGYSSLDAIVQTHPEVAKIDRHIVAGLKVDPFKKSIVKLLLAFCRENDIICVAEGIETRDDLDLLIELGVEAGQGYFLCRPKETIIECSR